MKKVNDSGCPHCGYTQVCPCNGPVCKAVREKTGRIPWRENRKNDCITCANCGFTAHMDYWEDYFFNIMFVIPIRKGLSPKARTELRTDARKKILAAGRQERI